MFNQQLFIRLLAFTWERARHNPKMTAAAVVSLVALFAASTGLHLSADTTKLLGAAVIILIGLFGGDQSAKKDS